MEKFCKNAVILGGYDLNFIRLVAYSATGRRPFGRVGRCPEWPVCPVRRRSRPAGHGRLSPGYGPLSPG